MSKPAKNTRQNLVVRVKGDPDRNLIFSYVWYTRNEHGRLHVYDSNDREIASFARGAWLYEYAIDCLVRSS